MNYTGNVNFTEQPPKYRFSATTGWETIRTWRGSKAKIQAFVDALESEGGYTSLEIAQSPSFSTVTATYATTTPTSGGGTPTTVDPITRTWSLAGNELNVSILGHPNAIDLYDSDKTWLAKVQARVATYKYNMSRYYDGKLSTVPVLLPKDETDHVKYPAANPWGVTGGTTTALNNKANALTEHLANGITSYAVSQYSLQKVELVSKASTVALSHTNVGKMHLHATLLTAEPTVPDSILINLTGLSSLYWLKKTPTMRMTSQGRYELSQEYWGFSRYSTFIYDTV